MLESLSTNELEYQKLSPEEQQARRILGRLVGVIADFKNPTRNQRKYSEKLWEKVFNDPLMQEKIKNKCCFGELGHPAERTEVDMEKIALCLAEVPKKGKDGCLHGVFDILDTPNGRILKCLCDYGCKVGVSSRGEGDLIETLDGEEVDPDTYACECWDAVLIPAVMSARPAYVTEALSTKTTLKESLSSLISQETNDNQKIIKESLSLLGIDDYSQEETLPVNNKENEPFLAVDNNEAANDVLSQFQESLKTQQKLQETISLLNEQLSVSYTKETQYQEEIEKYKNAISKLKESAMRSKTLESKVSKLESQITDLNQQLLEEKTKVNDSRNKLVESSNKNQDLTRKQEQFKESSNMKIQKLTEELNKTKQVYEEQLNNANKENQTLLEKTQTLAKDYSLKEKELNNKIDRLKKINERYHTIATRAVDKYIESKALSLGVSANEIKNKLSESYTFTDIDKVCDDLRQYKLTINSLPFSTNSITNQLKESSKVRTKPSTNESILPHKRGYEDVDIIDEQLLNLAKI